jgi:transcriptional regulator with XRE-family HTH domain
MSLALDFLKEYLSRPSQTQGDFAQAAGMTPPNVSDLLKGDVMISDRNLSKILRGLRSEKDRHDFLAAYLRDRIPTDYAEIVSVHLKPPADQRGLVMETGEGEPLELQAMQAFASLPSDLYRRRVIRFLSHLKKDAGLRDLFTRTVAYLEESDHSAAGTSYVSPVDYLSSNEDRRREKPPGGDVPPKAPSTSRRKTRATAPAQGLMQS